MAVGKLEMEGGLLQIKVAEQQLDGLQTRAHFYCSGAGRRRCCWKQARGPATVVAVSPGLEKGLHGTDDVVTMADGLAS